MTYKLKHIVTVALCAAALSGCNTTEDPRLEGVALSGGEAIAHNSMLQIIDPWPHGVTQTNTAVPAHQTAATSPVVVVPADGAQQ